MAVLREWRRVEEAPDYEVSDDGLVRNASGHLMSQRTHRDGHRMVGMYVNGKQKTFYVHRVVLKAFVGLPAKGQQCLHHNGNPSDNRVSNLRWGWPHENAADRRRHGSSKRLSRITEEDVRTMRETPVSEVSHAEMARRLGVTSAAVCDIRNFKRRKHG